MFFNPLFLQVINNPESINSAKSQKLNGASYLFSDIIKVAFEKSESESLSGTSASETASAGFGLAGGFDASAFLNEITAGSGQTESALYQLLGEVVPGSFKLGDLSGSSGIVGLPLVNNNDSKSIVLSETEVASMIAKFLDGNFHGKVNVLSGKNEQKKINVKSFDISDNKALSSDDLFELLKEGNAVSLESSDAQNTKGLLITLFKISSGQTAELSDSLSEDTGNSVNAETEKKPGAETADALSAAKVPSDKLYSVEITVIDKTGYQELSSLAFAKSGAPAANEMFQTDSGPNAAESIGMPLNQASKIFRMENGLNGPADMSAFSGVNEELASAPASLSPAASDSETQKTAPQALPAGETEKIDVPAIKTAQYDAAVKQTSSAEAAESIKNIPGSKPEISAKLSAGVKTENKQAPTEIKAAADSPVSTQKSVKETADSPVNTQKPVKETADPAVPQTDPLAGDKKIISAKDGSTAAASSQNSSRPADSITSAAQEDTAAASRLNRSGVLKNVNLTLKSSRTSKEISSETDATGGSAVTLKPDDKNTSQVPDQNPEMNTEIPAKDLKELNKNISDRIIAKQMHDSGTAVKDSEAKPVSAPAEKSEGPAEPKQEAAAAQNNSETADNDPTASANEQNAPHQKNENHNTGSNEIRFTSEINKASDTIVREKPAPESSQSNLPHKLVKAADVMKEISTFIERNEGHSLTIKIDPESLGTVKIALDMVDKLVHANIEVENEAAKKMMENNLTQLQHSLAQNGIQLNSLNISLANQDSRQNKNTGPRKKVFNNELESDFDQEGIKETRQMGYNTYEYTI